jgi:putative flippase GtrA
MTVSPPLIRRVSAERVRELVLFLLIGGTGALLYTALNVLFTRAGVRPSVSIIITLVILMPPVYYAQHRLTFRSGRDHRSAFPRYVGTQLFGNLLAMGAAEVFAAPIRANPLIAFVIIAAMVAAINYGILKFWAFRHTPEAA